MQTSATGFLPKEGHIGEIPVRRFLDDWEQELDPRRTSIFARVVYIEHFHKKLPHDVIFEFACQSYSQHVLFWNCVALETKREK